jgi:hypothetical protein
MVKLETTKDRRRLHIGSFFVDLNETDYLELIRIFSDEKKVIKSLSSNRNDCDHDPIEKGQWYECSKCGEML